MNEEASAFQQFERWARSAATVIAPATVVSTVLFYFGYVSARSQYEYFGIDVDTVGLGTQDYIMRSPQPLLVPLFVLAMAGIGILALLATTRRWVATAEEPDAPVHRIRRVRRLIRRCIAVGAILLGAGIVLLLNYMWLRGWTFYPLVTPLLIGLGSALVAYGNRVRELSRRAEEQEVDRSALLLRRSSYALVFVLVAVSVFWTTATVAQWSGRGLAKEQALTLDRLPSVILDTKERLFLRSPGVMEAVLPESEGKTFHYRYRNLRLLIHGNDRMFLVPNSWSASNSTLVVRLDDSVRVQFQFQNQQPG
jgi:hypothetical protein